MVDLTRIDDEAAFKVLVGEIKSQPEYPGDPAAFAIGLATVFEDKILDVRFPHTNVSENFGSAALMWQARQNSKLGISGQEIDLDRLYHLTDRSHGVFRPYNGEEFKHPNIVAINKIDTGRVRHTMRQGSGYRNAVVLAWVQDFDQAPTNTADAWLRLTLLSERKKLPNTMNLDGIFGLLNNAIWTDLGPFDASATNWDLFMASASVKSKDKFPMMLDYVNPDGVRIADGARVRLGAYLADGTTVMHEGFVNFNAGTLGRSMVEGRISQGVVVGNGTDVGGGASLMGTLSGGNNIRVSMGEDCLMEAESGLGFPVGDRVRIEAGLYIKGSTPITMPRNAWSSSDDAYAVLQIKEQNSRAETADTEGGTTLVKGEDLVGISDVVFRRNAMNGRIEVIPRGDSIWGTLTPALHSN